METLRWLLELRGLLLCEVWRRRRLLRKRRLLKLRLRREHLGPPKGCRCGRRWRRVVGSVGLRRQGLGCADRPASGWRRRHGGSTAKAAEAATAVGRPVVRVVRWTAERAECISRNASGGGGKGGSMSSLRSWRSMGSDESCRCSGGGWGRGRVRMDPTAAAKSVEVAAPKPAPGASTTAARSKAVERIGAHLESRAGKSWGWARWTEAPETLWRRRRLKRRCRHRGGSSAEAAKAAIAKAAAAAAERVEAPEASSPGRRRGRRSCGLWRSGRLGRRAESAGRVAERVAGPGPKGVEGRRRRVRLE